MCAPGDRLNSIEVVVDGIGQPMALVIHKCVQSDHTSHLPLSVSPFDTPSEVFERGMARLDIQMTLW